MNPAQANRGNTGGDNVPQTSPASVPQVNGGDPEASTTVPGGGRPGGEGGSTTVAPLSTTGGSTGSASGVPLVLAALAAALLVWMVAAPRVVRALAHRHDHSERDRVISAWQRTIATLSFAGAPEVAGSTPLEYADEAELATGVDHRALRELAVQVTRAVYSPRDIDEQAASRCELLSGEIDAICRDRTPTSVRLKALVDPRLMRRRIAG